MENLRTILPLILVWAVLVAMPPSANADAPGAAPRLRVLVSSDIGGTDPDDFQSMVHLFLYADMFDIEGLVSSPFGAGRKSDILTVIDRYERDYPKLKTYSEKYPTAEALRAISKQGAFDSLGASGFGEATEGSKWIIQCARCDDPRPLHLLVWGGIEDLAQALHDAPDILPKLRVYFIGGPNKKWSVDAYNYVEQNHPKLWMIEANATYRGWFTGGNQKGEWGNQEFVKQHIAGHGALGDYFATQLKGTIKMGDTPSLARLIHGTPEDPTQPSWGGKYVRIWDGRKTIFDHLTTAADTAEVFGVTEFALPVPDGFSAKNTATMVFDGGVPTSAGVNEGKILRFRFSPRDAKAWSYVIQSDFAGLNGKSGKFTAAPPPIERTGNPSAVHPNWWIDDPDPVAAEGVHPGAKSVNRWREDFLRDFAERMNRCANAAPTDAKTLSSPSPHAQVRSVGLDEVRWTDGFWAKRYDSLRNEMLPGLVRLMDGTDYSQYFRNFEIAAGLSDGGYRGAPFNDGDYYKLIEAVSAVYAVTHDDEQRRYLERAIAVIAKAQRPDGYIHTPVIVGEQKGDKKAVPFRDRKNFEVYNMGHLFTAASVHHRATGKTDLLVVATKAADFLEKAFANPTPELAGNSICPSHYMGLIDLYRETGERRYLELAKKFFAMRDLVAKSGEGEDDNQGRVPFLDQNEAVGHAVRANYLFAGAADLFAETGDPATESMLERVWTNVAQKKLYITGACGALHDGASPDGSKDQKHITRVHQAYGRNYQLPNTTAHNETCANIGNVLWNWRMFLNTGEARFMDVAELALYNSVLSGVSLDGTNFFYTNPLRLTDPMPVSLRWSRTRVPFVSSFCCPPNLARMLAEVSNYAYAKSAGTIWVNLYGASTLATKLPNGTPVKLTQETEYPWNGRVRITVKESSDQPFALKLRIPGWAKSASARVNLGPSVETSAPGTYFELRRNWKAGDTVDLDIPMPVQSITPTCSRPADEPPSANPPAPAKSSRVLNEVRIKTF